MSSQDFLDSFRRKLPRGTAPDRAKVKEALDYVFGSQRNRLDKYRPDQNQTRDFIDYLILAIREEDKLLTKDRCLALTKILDYNERPGAPKFPGIDPTYLTKTDPTVTIKLYSWGSPVQGTLLLSTFMTHYQGYVAADPPQFL